MPTEEAGWFRLRPGNTVALEPMLVAGAGRYKRRRDGWAVVTVDGSRARTPSTRSWSPRPAGGR